MIGLGKVPYEYLTTLGLQKRGKHRCRGKDCHSLIPSGGQGPPGGYVLYVRTEAGARTRRMMYICSRDRLHASSNE